jgi:hypothetical protein
MSEGAKDTMLRAHAARQAPGTAARAPSPPPPPPPPHALEVVARDGVDDREREEDGTHDVDDGQDEEAAGPDDEGNHEQRCKSNAGEHGRPRTTQQRQQ